MWVSTREVILSHSDDAASHGLSNVCSFPWSPECRQSLKQMKLKNFINQIIVYPPTIMAPIHSPSFKETMDSLEWQYPPNISFFFFFFYPLYFIFYYYYLFEIIRKEEDATPFSIAKFTKLESKHSPKHWISHMSTFGRSLSFLFSIQIKLATRQVITDLKYFDWFL